MYDLVETPLEGSRDVFAHKGFFSLGCNIVLPNPLDHFHAFPLCSLPSQSQKYYLDEPINNFLIYDANIDLVTRTTCLVYLVGMFMIICP